MTARLKTALSLTADSTQVRYQKALKEITKLISINTELREESNKFQTHQIDMQEHLQQLTDTNTELSQQIIQIRQDNDILILDRTRLIEQNEKYVKEIIQLRSQIRAQESVIDIRESENGNTPQVDKDTEKEKDQIIIELRKKLLRLQNNFSEFGFRTNAFDIRKSGSNYQLVKKLNTANEFIENLSTQNVSLRSQIIKAQSSQKVIAAKSLQNLSKQSPKNDIFDKQTRNSEQVLKRYHFLQRQNKHYLKKYNTLKNQQKPIIQQTNNLKKQNKKYIQKFKGYESLIERQQIIINELHNEHENEIKSMAQQFKCKLLEQRQNFSPAKSADHLKNIELLQQQNKSLKKRLQLFQIQLQKYVKTLEAYKMKLNQCQRDVDQLMKQRQQLIDTLSKLQNSHRQRSNYSRGSASKILMMGTSGNVDIDRRNSMGQTGHFTCV